MLQDAAVISFLIGLLVIAPLDAQSPYFLITPGGTYDIGSRLQIPPDHLEPMGRMAFTAVYEEPATWAEVARARLRGDAEAVPAVEVRPPGTSQEQVNATNKRLIDESKPIAAAVAMRAAGYPVTIGGQGAEVESVIEGLPADGVLQAGDVIVAVDGQPVTTTDALIGAISRHQVGDQVQLRIMRDGQSQDVQLRLAESPSQPGHPLIGITVSTYLFDVQLPFPVDIQSDNVGGPSAGFMFALGILDAVTAGDLTRGYYVAGTGTLAADGTVGPIGGAAEKALAAQQDGAQLFLVPKDNADEARRWVNGSSMQIVPIARFQDAVRYLCSLPPLPSAQSPELPQPCTTDGG